MNQLCETPAPSAECNVRWTASPCVTSIDGPGLLSDDAVGPQPAVCDPKRVKLSTSARAGTKAKPARTSAQANATRIPPRRARLMIESSDAREPIPPDKGFPQSRGGTVRGLGLPAPRGARGF